MNASTKHFLFLCFCVLFIFGAGHKGTRPRAFRLLSRPFTAELTPLPVPIRSYRDFYKNQTKTKTASVLKLKGNPSDLGLLVTR